MPRAEDLRRVIPTTAGGEPDGERIGAWSRKPPREQITLFNRLLRPLWERASDLVRQLDSETFPEVEASGKARSALISALKQLDNAVPGAPLVQDDYSFRCFPQVLACAWRALWHVVRILEVEINSANDNPLLSPHGGTPTSTARPTRTGRGRIRTASSSAGRESWAAATSTPRSSAC